MDADEVRAYLLAKPGAVEEHPFGPGTAVFKVMGKMFALKPEAGAGSVSLKCEPFLATLLRETYPAVTPGYHLNKRHWNTVRLDGTIPGGEIREMVDHSYDRVVQGLPKRLRRQLPGG